MRPSTNASRPAPALSDDEAIATLARRYFTTRGPATLKDFVWWSGLSTADARHGIEMAKDDLSSDARRAIAPTGSQRQPFHEHVDRFDLVQCYDEVIISYTESRDVLQTPQVAFPVPGRLDGFPHVVLHDGRLAGHWRPASGREPQNVETRMGETLDRDEQRALDTAVERYHGFCEG